MSWNSTGEGHGREYQLSLQDKLALLMEEIHTVRRDWKVCLEWVKRCSCRIQNKRVYKETMKRLQ